jgi:FixJ family two-component response regulator
MPVYECKIRGSGDVRLVKAATAAQARDHLAEAKPISAERMAELIESGAKLEKAGEAPATPPSPPADEGDENKGD